MEPMKKVPEEAVDNNMMVDSHELNNQSFSMEQIKKMIEEVDNDDGMINSNENTNEILPFKTMNKIMEDAADNGITISNEAVAACSNATGVQFVEDGTSHAWTLQGSDIADAVATTGHYDFLLDNVQRMETVPGSTHADLYPYYCYDDAEPYCINTIYPDAIYYDNQYGHFYNHIEFDQIYVDGQTGQYVRQCMPHNMMVVNQTAYDHLGQSETRPPTPPPGRSSSSDSDS